MAAGNGNSGSNRQGASVMWQAARKFASECATYKTRGNLETRAEAWEMPLTLAEIANGVSARAQANAKESLDPALAQMYEKLAATLHSCAQVAAQIGPAFDALHSQHVTTLLKGPNPEKWDTTNNAGAR